MRKVIVFKVENVLVNGFDGKKSDELSGRRLIREIVGNEMFEKEFMKDVGKRKEVMGCGDVISKMRDLEMRYEEEGDLMRKYWMRDVRKRLEDWEKGKEERLVLRRKKYLDSGLERKEIGIRGDLKDLERICEVTGSKMVFVSGERKSKIENLLFNNGLRRFEVENDLGFMEGMDEKEYVVFESVEDLRDMWMKIGLRRG